MIAACLRVAPDAAAGALLPRLFSTKEMASGCCAFPSDCASTTLSRTVLVQMLLNVEMKFPLQQSATSVRRGPVLALAFLSMLDSNDKSRYTKILGGQQRVEGLPHQIACNCSSIERIGGHRRRLLPISRIERLWLPLPAGPNGSPS